MCINWTFEEIISSGPIFWPQIGGSGGMQLEREKEREKERDIINSFS